MDPQTPAPEPTTRTTPQPQQPGTAPVTGVETPQPSREVGDAEVRDIAEVPAVEVITTAAVHLMSAAAVKCGLAEDAEPGGHLDLAEARVLISALAGLVTTAAPDLGSQHARALRDGLRSLQLAFREASTVPDAPGDGPGERLTGAVR